MMVSSISLLKGKVSISLSSKLLFSSKFKLVRICKLVINIKLMRNTTTKIRFISFLRRINKSTVISNF